MRSLVLLETTIAATLLVASGLTLAHHLLNTVYCPTSGWCEASDESEHIYGTDAKESIFAGDGEDQVDAFAGDDTVYDGGYGEMTLSTAAKAGTAYTVPSGMTNCLEPPGKTISTVMTATTICMVAPREIS